MIQLLPPHPECCIVHSCLAPLHTFAECSLNPTADLRGFNKTGEPYPTSPSPRVFTCWFRLLRPVCRVSRRVCVLQVLQALCFLLLCPCNAGLCCAAAFMWLVR